jgi:hypothetical protein
MTTSWAIKTSLYNDVRLNDVSSNVDIRLNDDDLGNSDARYDNVRLSDYIVLEINDVSYCNDVRLNEVLGTMRTPAFFLSFLRLLTLSPPTLEIHHQLQAVEALRVPLRLTEWWCFPSLLGARPSP